MIFDKPSTRTRVSFDIAMRQIGGQTLVLNRSDMQLGRGETIGDTARVLSRYADAIMVRCSDPAQLSELAENASIPVVNGMTNKSHPCQIMADILTFEEKLGSIMGKTITWIGDANNVATSWVHAAVRFGFKLNISCPEELSPDPALLQWVQNEGGDVTLVRDPKDAAKDADCVLLMSGFLWGKMMRIGVINYYDHIKLIKRLWDGQMKMQFLCIACQRIEEMRLRLMLSMVHNLLYLMKQKTDSICKRQYLHGV